MLPARLLQTQLPSHFNEYRSHPNTEGENGNDDRDDDDGLDDRGSDAGCRCHVAYGDL